MTTSSPIRHPATIALIALLVASVVGLQWVGRSLAESNSMQYEGLSGEEINTVFLWINAGYQAMQVLGFTAAAAALALVFVWCFWPRGAQSSDGTRTISAAGSTVKRAETTVPNSSPSTSNSSAPSPISMSTERPRE